VIFNSIVNLINAQGDSPYFSQKSRFNEWYTSERPGRGNKCEFQCNRTHLYKHCQTGCWSTWLIFFPSTVVIFTLICANYKSRKYQDVIADRLFPTTHSDKDKSESSSRIIRLAIFRVTRDHGVESRYSDISQMRLHPCASTFSLLLPLERIEKLFALRDALCIEYFSKCPLFLHARWPWLFPNERSQNFRI